MSSARAFALTTLAMIAFAGNSLLCRLALRHTSIDAASFTAIRLLSGAAMLILVARATGGTRSGRGNWPSALALFAYAAGFSFAYVSLPAATGALLLFGAVQATMVGYGIWRGERLHGRQWTGLLLAFCGLVGLLLPGLSAPPLGGALLMLGAGVAWGVYSLRGRGAGDPTKSNGRKLPARHSRCPVFESGRVAWRRARSERSDIRRGLRSPGLRTGLRDLVHGPASAKVHECRRGAIECPGHRNPGRGGPARRARDAAFGTHLLRHPGRDRAGDSAQAIGRIAVAQAFGPTEAGRASCSVPADAGEAAPLPAALSAKPCVRQTAVASNVANPCRSGKATQSAQLGRGKIMSRRTSCNPGPPSSPRGNHW
jgi:hypothetical protein